MIHTPLIIIGAGPGGYETAVSAARRGMEVTIIEKGPVGGTCLNEGCIPTKAFCKNAQVMEELRNAGQYGVENLTCDFRFGAVVERKNQIVEQLRSGVETLLSGKLIRLVRGEASFVDDHTVAVGEETYSADHIIIATGSSSQILPIPGAHLPGVLTSREILNVETIPHKLCVIGGGVIGMEFASVFRSLGSEVCVVEYAKDILPGFDSDISKRMKQTFSRRGIEIKTQAAVCEIVQEDGGLSVVFEQKGKKESVTGDCVLMAVGRRANVDALNLSDIGIEYTPKGIVVNDMMQTNLPHIYAIGDVNGRKMLAHAAVFQGLRALNHLTGNTADGLRLDVVPAAVFTFPEAAAVGLSEDDCRSRGIACKCSKAFYRANGKALCMGEPDGMCKLVVAEDGKLLGCHLYGAHAADLIQEVCALITQDATLEDYRRVIHVHPALSEVLQTAAHGG